MVTKDWTLIDQDNSQYIERFSIKADEVEGDAKDYAVSKGTMDMGLSRGVDVLRVDNGTFAFDILPTRGMGIWKAWLDGTEIGWQSPIKGPVNPAFVDLGEPSGLGWLDGFDEFLVRCGLESNGAPEFDDKGQLKWPLHGRIANKPAHKLTLTINGDTGEITVSGLVRETRFHFLKVQMNTTISTRVGEPGFRIIDEVQNLSASPAEVQMLYHVNFGIPMLDAGSQFVAPVQTVVPRNQRAAEGIENWNSYTAEETGFEEQVYFLELLADANGRTQTLLKNAHGTMGASMFFNKRRLPCFTVWKNTTALPDGYVTGLEPGTNFPNPRSYEGKQKRVASLDGGGSITFDFQLEVHKDAAEVEAAEQQIATLQGDTKPKVYVGPQEGWCAPEEA